MKKILIEVVLFTSLILTAVGCNNSSEEQKITRASLEKQIMSLGNIGFDINKTADSHYILTVVDSKLVTIAILTRMNLGIFDSKSKEPLEELIKDVRLDIDIDWDKYTHNAEKSLFVYYAGNGRENSVLKKLISEKKLGVFLTFDENAALSKAEMKNINETISNGAEKIHLFLENSKLHIDKKESQKVYRIDGGKFKYTLENNNSKQLDISYNNVTCNASKENAYLGSWDCSIPSIVIKAYDKDETTLATLTDTSFKYRSYLKSKKLNTHAEFNVPSIEIDTKSGRDGAAITINNFGIIANSNNTDEAQVKELYSLINTPTTDYNTTFVRYAKMVGKLMNSGITLDAKMSLASVDAKILEDGDISHFTLREFSGSSKGLLGETLEYETKSQVKDISLKKDKAKNPIFELKDLRFGYKIKDLYNFFPAFMELAATVARKDTNNYKLSKEEQEKLTNISNNIANNGFIFSLAPIGIESVSLKENEKLHHYGKLDFNLDALLLKNDLNMNSPMAPMMLLSFLQADGKLVLQKSDLEQMSNSFPPQIMAMVMLYAKYDENKVIFEVKFEKGHLLVNDKPVM